MVLFIRDMTGEHWPDRDDSPCDCAAYDEVNGHHTKHEHEKDLCGAWASGNRNELCGGCWGCLAMQLEYWENQKKLTERMRESEPVRS